MEEREIIKSTNNTKLLKILKIVLFALVGIALVSLILFIYAINYDKEATQYSNAARNKTTMYVDKKGDLKYKTETVYSSSADDKITKTYPLWHFWADIMKWIALVVFIVSGIGLIVLGIFYFVVNRMELVITTKRAYGKTIFGKRVDLPVDSISSTGKCMFNGIFIATSSGKIKFLLMTNRDDLHKVVSDLIIERQKKEKVVETPKVENIIQKSDAEEIKKYKELLDEGIISEEEFEAKKKQLLNL